MWNRLNKSMMFCQMMFGLSFYGVMVILTRFFLEDLNYNEADTMMVVGAFCNRTAVCYCRWFHRRQILRCLLISNYRFPRIREWLRFTGTRRSSNQCSYGIVWYCVSKLCTWFDVSFLPKSLQTHVQNTRRF